MHQRQTLSQSLLRGGVVAACGVMAAFGSSEARAANYYGRILTGGYASTERFTELTDGTQRNDFATISSRFYLHGSEITRQLFEFNGDLRDKHDFFDKFDSERLQLTPGNTLQLRQLNFRRNSDTISLFGGLGRMPIPEAGAVHTDGFEIGNHWSRALSTGLFGGFNPQRVDQKYMEFNSKANVFGAYSLYQPRSDTWTRFFYEDNAVVGQAVEGHLDRLYYFNNTIYQWAAPSQLVGMLYLDFVPKTYVQNAYVSWQEQWNPKSFTNLDLVAIDTIEYSRRKGVLEILAPSPYREISVGLKQTMNALSFWNAKIIYGQRKNDALTKTELVLGPTFSRFLSRHLSLGLFFDIRRNFTTTDTFLKGDLGYYSTAWESTLSGEYGVQRQNDGKNYHPMIIEASVSHYISKALYATLSLQDAATERVTIYSTFFKLGYRFGSQNVPPLRDGAPPPGRP